jgi:peptidoglycan hydrolase-like protein with peptidoglycan-binding domain
VFLRLFCIIILAAAFSGCASTQTKTQNEQLTSRVTDLEKNLQSKDAEIVDLQYQVKDLSSKVDTIKPGDSSAQVSSDAQNSSGADQSDKNSIEVGPVGTSIIRVKASPEKIQTALKAAGVYTGPVDGKIGAGTKAAIVEFQKSHGLKSDGVLGRRTWEALKQYLK